MSRLEIDVFPISNLRELTCLCRLYRVRGLTAGDDEYDQNVQILVRQLKRRLRTPVTVISRDGQAFLVVPDNAGPPPSPFQLVRTTAHFDALDEFITLDFEHPDGDMENVCAKFLQFAIDGALFTHSRFWQPSAGHPFL